MYNNILQPGMHTFERKAIITHLEHIIIIYFPLQKWLLQRVSILVYTYITCFDKVSWAVLKIRYKLP